MEETKNTCKHAWPDICDSCANYEKEKEWNLSDQIEPEGRVTWGSRGGWLETEAVKEFIRKEDQLIQDYAQGRISYPELIMKRDKLIGEGLK